MVNSPGSWRDPKNLLLLTFTLVACFVAGELLLRQLPLTDRLGFQQVPDVAERITDVGPRQPGRVRILGVGDSFTVFRDQQGRNYLRFAAAFANANGQAVDVVNLGEAGTGLDAYARNLLRFGDAVSPDTLVIGLYFGDDLVPHRGPTVRARFTSGDLLQPDEVSGSHALWSDVKDFFKQSVLISFVYRRLKVYVPALRSGHFDIALGYLAQRTGVPPDEVRRRLAKVDPEMIDLARADAINGWDLAHAICEPRYYADTYTLPEGSANREKLGERLDDLSFIIAQARRRGIEPAVVFLHPGIVVAERYREYYRKLGYVLPPLTRSEYLIIDAVAQHLDGLNVPYLDSLPLLRASNTDDYIPNDIHINSSGQEIVGRALFRLLEDRGLLGGN